MANQLKKPSELTREEYKELSEFWARRIAARTPSTAAVLSRGVLSFLQDSVLCPFWQGDKNNKLEPLSANLFEDYSLAAIDLCVGNEMLVIEANKEEVIDRSSELQSGQYVELPPKCHAIIKSREYIFMPPFLVGLLISPVDSAISCLSNISTMLDPLFEGFLILNITNLSSWKIKIKPGMVVSRVVFHMVAYIDQIQVIKDYPRTHAQFLTLKEILKKRVDRMKEESRVYSEEIREILDKWIKKSL